MSALSRMRLNKKEGRMNPQEDYTFKQIESKNFSDLPLLMLFNSKGKICRQYFKKSQVPKEYRSTLNRRCTYCKKYFTVKKESVKRRVCSKCDSNLKIKSWEEKQYG